jgi:CheY-like chemotaxis protein
MMMALKILFVDDEQFRVGKWKRRLSEGGFAVIPFDSVVEVLKYCDDNSDIDGMILDVMMPTPEGIPESITEDGNSTGIYLLQQLREYIEAHRLPVVVVTNRQFDEVSERVNEVGFTDGLVGVCHKPNTTPDELYILLKQLTEKWRGKRPE